eukprot:TRINITY_DN21903_c0_g1_i1.p1 TRINITY_DN21903_c0_g1~~TRINITY_DN21903_c0_g1_i1.p1  ORF type:complete len:245 (-),score=6.79 TRINITY_DN21903_c0_g1_i1:55-738(-)
MSSSAERFFRPIFEGCQELNALSRATCAGNGGAEGSARCRQARLDLGDCVMSTICPKQYDRLVQCLQRNPTQQHKCEPDMKGVMECAEAQFGKILGPLEEKMLKVQEVAMGPCLSQYQHIDSCASMPEGSTKKQACLEVAKEPFVSCFAKYLSPTVHREYELCISRHGLGSPSCLPIIQRMNEDLENHATKALGFSESFIAKYGGLQKVGEIYGEVGKSLTEIAGSQ